MDDSKLDEICKYGEKISQKSTDLKEKYFFNKCLADIYIYRMIGKQAIVY